MSSRATNSATLIAQLGRANRLPSPPGVALRIVELCQSQSTSTQDLAAVIGADAALTARLLKYANSPMSGIGHRITSVQQAIQFLGLRSVQVIALGFSLPTGRGAIRCKQFNLKQFWTETVAAAVIASRLARKINSCDPEDAFTAGILSNFGKLALATSLPDEYEQVLTAVASGVLLANAELAQFGVDHRAFGADLLAHWGLPDQIVHTIRYMNRPTDAPRASRSCAEVVSMGSRLAPLFIRRNTSDPATIDELRASMHRWYGLSTAEWNEIAVAVIDDYRGFREILDVDLEDQLSVTDLFADAHREATRLAMAQQLDSVRLLQHQTALLQRASTDPLTQAANRAKFDECLSELLKAARRDDQEFALILLDVDNFKQINDTLGHTAGDLVLVAIVKQMKALLRETDLLARYGGDEFMILAKGADRAVACQMAERIIHCVDRMPVSVGDRTIDVTISAGIAVRRDFKSLPEPIEITALADAQLYRSKRKGRNCWSQAADDAAKIDLPR